MPIINQHQYPDAKWLEPDQFAEVGTAGPDRIILVGKDDMGTPLVARTRVSDLSGATLDPIELYLIQTNDASFRPNPANPTLTDLRFT